MAIVDVVMSSQNHPTAEEIHQQIMVDFPMTSLATVYKTLNVLKELGEVVELRVDGCGHYETAAAPHAHLVCVRCHTIVDLPAEALSHLSEKALAETRFQPLRYNVEIYGLCSECQKKDKAGEPPETA
jgi:Fur family peroxide stress response transcriptional regulator